MSCKMKRRRRCLRLASPRNFNPPSACERFRASISNREEHHESMHCNHRHYTLGFGDYRPSSPFAQSINPWIGTWNTNLAKSTYSPGPPPRSQILTIQAEGQGHRLTVETINAEGNPVKLVLVRPHEDGKPYPVMGVA